MKSSIVTGVLAALTTVWAVPVTEVASDSTNEFFPIPQSLLFSKFDVAAGEGWLITPPGAPKAAVLKFYQNNSLMAGRKGSAWVVEFQEDVDAKQVKALANVRNALNEQPPARPYAAPAQRQTPAQPGTVRPAAAPAKAASGTAPGAIVPAAQLVAPAAGAIVPAGMLAPIAQLATAQDSPTITGLIKDAGKLIGEQIGVSIGNSIGSVLERVVNNYFPPPKSARKMRRAEMVVAESA